MERIFSKTKLEERTWVKLVKLDTLHWYNDGPEPTVVAHRYDAQVHQRKSITLFLGFLVCTLFHSNHSSSFVQKWTLPIKQQATKKKEEEGQLLKEMSLSNPSTKRKLPEKQGHLPKKPKFILEPIVGLEAEGKKTVTPTKHGARNGFMKGPSTTQEKPPVLLREDSKYALEKLSSIITSDNYEDLSNHAIEAMGETGLFCIAQVSHVHPLPILPVHLPPSLTTFVFRRW